MTRRWTLAALAVFSLCFAPVFAQDPAAPAQRAQRITPEEAKAQVTQADEQRRNAMIKADIAALEPMLADGLVYTHSSGKVDTKTSLLEALKSGKMKYESIVFSDTKANVFGNTVIVAGVAEIGAKNGDQTVKFKARFTEVWVRQRGQWKFAAWQTTRLPEETAK